MLTDQPKLASQLIVRENMPDDDAEYARLLSMVMAGPYDVELLRERRDRWKQKYWFVRVAELDGRVVGILELNDTGGFNCAMVRIVVDPDLRGQGIGTRLLKEIRDNPVYTDRKVFGEVRDDDPKSLSFVEKVGMATKAHVFESTINPQEFDLAKFQPDIDRVLASGLKFATLAELGDSEENRYRLWEIEHVTDKDIPGLDVDRLTTWEDSKQSWFSSSWYYPPGEFLVLDGDKWVAASATAELSPGVFYVQHTCVLREYRGRGIATAVKAIATENARQRGATLLKANNHSENHAVLAISRKFGFQPQPGLFEIFRPPLTNTDNGT
ncbi:MAG: GNAT family N-acetyltransferase [Chlorobia bacterium]|nr:GNAT family N-acetyltransferase [Fimbriimonadaceae bacterium]